MVEVADTYLSESAKGQRHLTRPPRRHATLRLNINEFDRVWVVLACDRHGHHLAAKLDRKMYDAARPPETPTVPMLASVLLPRLSPGCALYTERRTWYRGFCRWQGLPHREVHYLGQPLFTEAQQRWRNESEEIQLGYHINNAGDQRRRLKPWLSPFHGVSTRYLDNYLMWFGTSTRSGPRLSLAA